MSFVLKPFIVSSLVVTILSGCAVVPTFSNKNTPPSCQLLTKSIDLKFIGPKSLQGTEPLKICGHSKSSADTCALVMIVVGGMLLSSAIISSSIYVVGNTAYYLEKAVRCNKNGSDRDKVNNQEKAKFVNEMTALGAKEIELEALKQFELESHDGAIINHYELQPD